MTSVEFYSKPSFSIESLLQLTRLTESELSRIIAYEADFYYHHVERRFVGWLPSLSRSFLLEPPTVTYQTVQERVAKTKTLLETVLDETVFVTSSKTGDKSSNSMFITPDWSRHILELYGVDLRNDDSLILIPHNPRRKTYCGHKNVMKRLADRAEGYTAVSVEQLEEMTLTEGGIND